MYLINAVLVREGGMRGISVSALGKKWTKLKRQLRNAEPQLCQWASMVDKSVMKKNILMPIILEQWSVSSL